MCKRWLVTILLLGLCSRVPASEPDSVARGEAAFFEGNTLDYVIQPPRGFRMFHQDSLMDDYSFFFIPDTLEYAEADILIGVNVFSLHGVEFEQVLSADTIALRKHYGVTMDLWPVDSITTAGGSLFRTYYINDQSRFIPNVMVSYFDGGTELLILELVISESALRVKAEERFLACLRNVKVLARGELDHR